MELLDWIIVGIYALSAIGIGVYYSRRAAQSTADYFLAGRTLPWFVIGTSIVATTFSSDTPLVVAGISRQTGICGHWFWLSAAIGQTATAFFFARLWRRTEVMTDIEFIIKRYEPSMARSLLRIFNVFFDGVLINCIVMASVTLAMVKIIKALLDLPDTSLFYIPIFGDVSPTAILLVALGGTAVVYSAMSGLYGVSYTDLLQFTLAMVGSVGLAIIVYIDASGDTGLMGKLATSPGFKPRLINFFPDVNSSALMIFTFLVYILVTWWHRAPGNGYYVQRLLAARSEKESFLAFLWFNICQYIIRPWPWIIVGLLSLYYLPQLEDPENSFPMMIDLFLPTGLKGLMVTSMLAAYMSTIDTRLNWGTSYIINDFYQPFINSGRSARHYVFVSRICMLLLTISVFFVTTKLTSVLGVYKYLGVVFGGIGTVMVARWYWWRVSAYSEIAAIITSLIIANYLQVRLPSTSRTDLFAVRVVFTVLIVTVVWVAVTFLTSSKNPSEHTIAFYTKMRIAGPGWRRVRKFVATVPESHELMNDIIAWFLCLVFLFSLTLGVGKLILHQWTMGVTLLGIAAVGGYMLKRAVAGMQFL